MTKLRIIFFGLGSIGLRHASILTKNPKVDLYAYRTFKGQRKNKLKVKEVTTWKEIDALKPDVAFITNPTALHIDTALACAKRGMHLFIEKPLGHETTKLEKLLNCVQKEKVATYIGYVLRFHPVILKLKEYLKDKQMYHLRVRATSDLLKWRKGMDPLKNCSARKDLGGGVVLDLSHELDYVDFMLGGISQVCGQFSRRSKRTVDAEDYADFLAKTPKGPVNIHINFLSQKTQRLIEVDCEGQTLQGDLLENKISTYKNGKLLKVTKFPGTIADCYQAQIKYFLKNIGNRRMMNNVFEAAGLFRNICSVKEKGYYCG